MKSRFTPRRVWRTLFAVLFVFECVIASGALSITPTFTIFGLIITLLAVWCVLEYTDTILRTSKIHDHYSFVMAVLIPLTVYLDAAGDLLHGYELIPYYDAILHFVSPAIGCVWMWHLLHALYPKISSRAIGVFSVALTLAAGALYEIEEYLEDVFTGSHRLGDAWDTGNDLTMDFFGPLCAVVILTLWNRWKKRR